jgi:hypothetical protein
MVVKLGPWGVPSTCHFLVFLWAGIKIEKGYIPNINTKSESWSLFWEGEGGE